ncbi:MAG: hypothetical protein LQ338_006465 [Usnochroma carphineum]|nr:MAG: hypothetical protein LQ338_006465 [Usnochroma carphineum]
MASNASQLQTPSKPTFFSLPPEIRRMVYRNLFRNTRFFPSRQRHNHNKLESGRKAHAVLYVCKIFYNDAAPALYESGILCLSISAGGADELAEITRIIPPLNSATITRVRFNVQRGAATKNLHLYNDTLAVSPQCLQPFIQDLPSLRELQITCKRLLHLKCALEDPMDFHNLKHVSILVKPEHVNRGPIGVFKGLSAVPFKVGDSAVTLDCGYVSIHLHAAL